MERAIKMQYNGQIAHWEKNYLEIIKEIAKTLT